MCQSFGYTRVLNMTLALNTPEFWIYHSSEYTRVAQGSEYTWLIPEYAWICLIMSEYVWICLNLPEWLLFYIPPFHDLFYNPFSTGTHGYLFELLQEIKGCLNMRLFSWSMLEETKFVFFFHSNWKYFICFLFETKYFYK